MHASGPVQAEKMLSGFQGNIPDVENFKALPPCAVGGFMSNIKDVPNGHASSLAVRAHKTPGA